MSTTKATSCCAGPCVRFAGAQIGPRGTAWGCGFNRSMQHTEPALSRRSVADEAATADLLLRQPEGADVEALEGRGHPAPDCAAVRSISLVDTEDPCRDRWHSAVGAASFRASAEPR